MDIRDHDERRAVIAGCGYVGEALARRLLAGGWQVWGVRRGPLPALGAGFTPVKADLGDTDALRTALAGVEDATLFYLAAAGGFSEKAYRAVYVEGLAAVLDSLAAPRRVLFASSTAVYGQEDGSWVDEASPTEPHGFSGKVLLQAEALAARHGGIAVRFGGIYGPGRTRLIDEVRRGLAVAALDFPQYRSRIHRDDCAGVMAHLAAAATVEPLYLAVDDDPADMRQVQAWLCRMLGRDPNDLAAFAGTGHHGGNKRCRNARLRRSGYRLGYPTYREGYAALLSPRGS